MRPEGETTSMEDKKKAAVRNRFGVVVVLGCFVFLCPFGDPWSFGNMAPYMVSYHRARALDPHREWVEMQSAAFLAGNIGVFTGLTAPLTGWVMGQIGTRPTAALATFLYCVPTLLTAPALRLSYWAAVVMLTVVRGVASGLAYVTVVHAATQWLPQNRGLAIGVTMVGLGGFAVVLIPVQTAFINPDNKPPLLLQGSHSQEPYFTQPEVLDQVPLVFLVMGALYGLLLLASTPLVLEYRDVEPPSNSLPSVANYVWTVVRPQWPDWRRGLSSCGKLGSAFKARLQKRGAKLSKQNCSNPPPCVTVEQLGAVSNCDTGNVTSEQSLSEKTSTEALDNKSIGPLQLLKRWDFYLVWVAFAIQYTYNVCVISLYKAFGESAAFDDHSLALVGSLAALSNCTGRVFWGVMADHVPCKTVLLLVVCGLASFMCTFYATQFATVWIFGAWVCVMFFCLGGFLSVTPVCVLAWYGPQHFGTNYGIIYTGSVVGSILAMVMVPVFTNLAIGWSGLFLVTGSTSALGILLIILGGDRPLKQSRIAPASEHETPQRLDG